MKMHKRMAARFQDFIHQWDLLQQSQWCHVTRPTYVGPANQKTEEPQACCIWNQKHQRVLYQNIFFQHDGFALPGMSCCFQSFGKDNDVSYKRLSPTKTCLQSLTSGITVRYQIQRSIGGAYTTDQIHCLLAQPVQLYSNITSWTTLHSRVNFSCTGSMAVPHTCSWPGYHCLLQHAVLQAAKPLQGLITSNYNT